MVTRRERERKLERGAGGGEQEEGGLTEARAPTAGRKEKDGHG